MRLVGNCMPISIYLGTMCWKGTGITSLETFLDDVDHFFRKINFFKYIIII